MHTHIHPTNAQQLGVDGAPKAHREHLYPQHAQWAGCRHLDQQPRIQQRVGDVDFHCPLVFRLFHYVVQLNAS